MSSLHCPARIFLVIGAAPPTRWQGQDLADRLASERIARVWCSPREDAVQTARLVSERLAVDVVVSEDLRAETLASRLGPFLDEVSDAHPGEAVLVLGDGQAETGTLPEHHLVELAKDVEGSCPVSPEGGTRQSTPGRTPRAATPCGPPPEA